ncbi:hypothetical protein [Pseudoclavibacter sp. CFCC 13611]|uniref:hypothetical protein n=1 Tax=Pseudoclavibacter sp. CFCC 13611 TaxID=2615178 RepID=UPI0013018197|nr:hypothetical protein [Pseudoclavibacter sp. CFCC 13611]KAB1662761.1 hypothetical protein F8O08_09320 [Pseudoclavibacter sp. CFCC 13611]
MTDDERMEGVDNLGSIRALTTKGNTLTDIRTLLAVVEVQRTIIAEQGELLAGAAPRDMGRLRALESALSIVEDRKPMAPVRGSTVGRAVAAEVAKHPEGVTPAELCSCWPEVRRSTVQNRMARAAEFGLIRRLAPGLYGPLEGGDDE